MKIDLNSYFSLNSLLTCVKLFPRQHGPRVYKRSTYVFFQAIPGSNSSVSGNVRSHTSDYWCRYDSKNHSETLFHIAFFVSSYAVPLLVIVILYIIMLRRLWRPSPAMTITKSTRRPGAMAAVAATVGVAAQTANASAAVKAAANKVS